MEKYEEPLFSSLRSLGTFYKLSPAGLVITLSHPNSGAASGACSPTESRYHAVVGGACNNLEPVKGETSTKTHVLGTAIDWASQSRSQSIRSSCSEFIVGSTTETLSLMLLTM